ncbi:hypothetical protein [Pseudonocardia sp. ICBG601]|uniref:hypothetical protein n=1 Tax=Pseudonocardia sp. ICBG601 TaxID=2846759 RepID=UPI001CF60ED9|nr:hypothetical protein [Pseudonocardia sp. ICBG601]
MSGLVAVVAWAALAGWIAAGVLLVLAHRRLEQLEREHTARKWDIVALRAELRALRALHRRPDEPSDPAVSAPGVPVPAGGTPGGTRTAGATAWRRSHRRPVGRTRRRPS